MMSKIVTCHIFQTGWWGVLAVASCTCYPPFFCFRCHHHSLPCLDMYIEVCRGFLCPNFDASLGSVLLWYQGLQPVNGLGENPCLFITNEAVGILQGWSRWPGWSTSRTSVGRCYTWEWFITNSLLMTNGQCCCGCIKVIFQIISNVTFQGWVVQYNLLTCQIDSGNVFNTILKLSMRAGSEVASTMWVPSTLLKWST